MNTYILSNTNVNSLNYYLDQEVNVVGSCAYGNYLIDLLNADSDLYNKDIDLVILLLDGDELRKGSDLQEVFSAVRNFISGNKCLFLFSTVVLKPFYIDSYLNYSSYFEFNTNKKIIEFQRENENVFILDIHKIIVQHGSKNCLDDKFWYIGKIKYSSLFFEQLSKEINSIASAINSNTKKVLVLDLDNTIWGGIIGEDDGNIQLSNEGVGKIYLEFQQNLKYLKNLGILLAINSKNNYDDAIKGLSNKNSILSKDDFVVIKANWKNKVSNMIEIANELNLGTDSFVFIDDNPVERELVKLELPEVAVPGFPENLDEYNEWFVSDVVQIFFPKVFLSTEDKLKTKQYKANKKRNNFKSSSVNIESFIESLEIDLNVIIDNIENGARFAQLTQKTNQFNLTTRRHNINDITRFINSDSYLVYSIEYKDKFMVEGVVGLSIVSIEGERADLDVFLLSCRVLGRNVESYFLEKICSSLIDNQVKIIIGHYYPTNRNKIVNNFYTKNGFIKQDNTTFIKEIE
jgi:FkbH-like protein